MNGEQVTCARTHESITEETEKREPTEPTAPKGKGTSLPLRRVRRFHVAGHVVKSAGNGRVCDAITLHQAKKPL